MRRFLFILLGCVLGSVMAVTAMPVLAQEAETQDIPAQDEAPFDASTEREDGQILAFVGQKIFVREDERPPASPEKDKNGEDYITIRMDSRYAARYEILDLISGKYDSEKIDFYAYDHYGIPRFSKSKNILTFVYDGPKSRAHSKYNFYEVHRTQDGDWAACGDAYVQYDPDEKYKESLEPISFLEPVTVNIPSLMVKLTDELDEGEIISDTERSEWQAELDEENKETNGLYQAPIWKREGNIATCQMGTRVQDLYDFQNQIRFLPEKREEICGARHALELEALGDDRDAKRVLRKDCEDLLEIQNLP